MSTKRILGAVLSAALLLSLCACGSRDVSESPPLSSNRPKPTQNSDDQPWLPWAPVISTPPSEEVDPNQEVYDPSHRLNVEIPALIDGLELPVIGATGYATVELPLWPELPGGEAEGAGAPAPEPSQESTPAPTPTPEPTPEPTPTPEPPAPTAEGGQAPEDAQPAAGEDAGVAAASLPEGGEPVADAPAQPDGAAAAPGQESAPEPSQESTPAPTPTPEPTPEPASTPEPTPTPTPAPTPTPEPTPTPDPYEGAAAVLEPGDAFRILMEDGAWWYVSRSRGSLDESGWVEHKYCMINLPDVIPSIIYNDTNAYSSLFVSCGKSIPNVTGFALYSTSAYNDRLGKKEFMMPILYSAARNICAAQHRALAEGNCLEIYQTFRPLDTQRMVANALSNMAKNDPEVKAGISTLPWSISWFIATGVSNHQKGYALDVSIVKVYDARVDSIGQYPYVHSLECRDYTMPTEMHELSMAAISTVSPSSNQLSSSMNAPAIALRKYFTDSGLSPLASEWWHFNDMGSMRATADRPSNGAYYITECFSTLPG